MFISTVLSNPETLPCAASASSGALPGFWRSPQRFNVAVTRAKALLVVVGHPVVLMEDASWRELLRCAGCRTGGGAGQAGRLAGKVRWWEIVRLCSRRCCCPC